MDTVLALWRNTKSMPLVLRMFCQGAMVAPPILALFLVLPLMEWTVNERKVSYAELWSSGAGPVLLATLAVATFGAWGLASRARWSRWLWVVTPLVPVFVAMACPKTWFTEGVAGDVDTWLGALATGALIFACLFLVPSVRAYIYGHASATDA
jgi:hypothetical protein